MEIKNMSFGYTKDKNVLNNISLKIELGKITTIIGANGCGKSTLFNCMSKNLKPQLGSITIDSENIDNISLKNFAKKVAIVHQYNTAPSDITVEKLVGYGRIAHKSYCRFSNSSEDERLIKWAMDTTNIYELKNRKVSELSGGQRQRVWIAMALAQNTKILFLDEPTTYLDIKYQIEVLRLIKMLNTKYNITIVMVLHDINQAIYYSDNIVAMKNGSIIASGSGNQIVTSKLIYDIYGIELNVENINNQKFVITV